MAMDTYTEGWSHACCLVCSQLLWPKNPQKPQRCNMLTVLGL